MSLLLELQDLGLQANGLPLVTGLSLQVRSGERWCVIGRNASGKSTLLRAVAGLPVPAQQGRVRLHGLAATGPHAASLRAYMPQHSQDRFALRVADLLSLQAQATGLAAATGRAPAATDARSSRLRPTEPAVQPKPHAMQPVAQALDIAPLLGRPVTQLSGGERQRVALAAVALQNVGLWLLDEPVSFQDPAHQGLVAQWLCGQGAQAMLMSAHDMAWVQRTATHVLALLPGGAWRAGPVHEVLSAATLQATFGCAWQQLGEGAERIWVAR